ncbi:hypothetical protein Fmac_019570 [Flemingia macrophylla]|uniref:Nonsense-mediated mRNA decay factor SMG8 n=1 Tax=Flemingia macrophylla TaxID=520843 RepID=A0ABD1M866_9FABA
MEPRNPSSPVRVLIRPPSSSSAADHPSPPLPRSTDGVVVVGFVARRHHHSAQLLNRVIDSNAFASGNLDTPLLLDDEEAREWFSRRRISYFHDHDKGILFLHFSSNLCPAIHAADDASPPPGFDSAVEEHEFGDLQGLLFMFSVCHVIVYIQEGSHFGTRSLRNFRVLQAAKHAMAPFVRSQTMPPLPSRSHPSSSSRPAASTTNNSSPGRGGGNLGRNVSAISLMSGLGSYASLFPGQCIPVILFVFIDDFSSLSNSSANGEESTDVTSVSQSSGLSGVGKGSLQAKGSGSVVVLARPASRSEGGFRKKLQSSLEAQIRFLVKKCRTLSGTDITHSGVRTGGTSTTAPLFSLDASRTVVLLDRFSNQRGESLEFAGGLVEDVLNGKATSDSLLLESHGQSASKEDLISVKEFIYRQSDILRGRGGLINTNSGSAAGVGMVAVAAAAAAASAASGKTFTTPDLPNLEVWLSSCRHILSGLLSAKGCCLDDFEIIKRKPRPRNNVSSTLEGSLKSTNPLDVAVSWLQSGRGLNTKFSTLWCQRAIPAAKEIYLKDLPACYPTKQHEMRLDKALHAFRSMVKGPAVEVFAKKLEEECTSIWNSGRQLCDAVSLTGNPCMHQRHDVETSNSDGASPKPHSSGYFFLHACCCGRTRQLRPDPFDFESADVNCFSDCDKLLPAVKLPEIEAAGPVQSSSWSLLRIGGARYYESSKGLLQSGFSATEKFLLKWTIYLEKQKRPNDSTESIVKQDSVIRERMVEYSADSRKTGARQAHPAAQDGVEDQGTSLDIMQADDKKISFGRGFPIFKMRKPFSEVVAGSAAGDSGFPPLQQRKLPTPGSEKGMKQSRSSNLNVEQVNAAIDHEVSLKSHHVSSTQEPPNGNGSNICRDGDPFLRIGSNVVPVYLNGGERNKSHSLRHSIVYVGFEHECPRGHRFLLNAEHLTELGSSYTLSEESQMASVEPAGRNQAYQTKVSKNASWNKVHRSSNEILSAISNMGRDVNKYNELIPNGDLNSDALPKPLNLIKDFEGDIQAINMDNDDIAFSMLNQNLPIYMICPHCRHSRNKKDTPKVKFASGISQLKRIFLVTPAFPVILATCPVVQFETSCLPPSVPDRAKKLQFSLGCQVILPPESFLTLKLPFVYGVQLEDGNKHPLKPLEQQPEMTAWITKGTILQILSKGNSDEGYQTQ